MERIVIHFAGSAVAVEYAGQAVARLVEFIFRHAPRAGEDAPHVTYRALETGDGLALYREGDPLYAGRSGGALAELLMGGVCHDLADGSRGGLLFHAAALAWQGEGVLLPGAIGAGKSTLVAWLAARGFTYLTDEMVYVPQGADAFHAFTRPLNLKVGSLPVLASVLDLESRPDAVLEHPAGVLIAPALFGAPASRPVYPLRRILFPRYRPQGEFELRPLSGAQAGKGLMECLVNARNLPGRGFREVARLARVVPAWQMEYSHFEQIEGSLLQM
jgi:hypothetical protein